MLAYLKWLCLLDYLSFFPYERFLFTAGKSLCLGFYSVWAFVCSVFVWWYLFPSLYFQLVCGFMLVNNIELFHRACWALPLNGSPNNISHSPCSFATVPRSHQEVEPNPPPMIWAGLWLASNQHDMVRVMPKPTCTDMLSVALAPAGTAHWSPSQILFFFLSCGIDGSHGHSLFRFWRKAFPIYLTHENREQ